MQGARWWLVCYDVRDAKRLRKAAKQWKVTASGCSIRYSAAG